MTNPLVIAHRGYSAVAPENTMLAFQKAREAGADGIEIDVHFTKDSELVVIHDERVNRTSNGNGLVVEHTLEEIKKLDAGSWFSTDTVGEQIPTFRQVCELIADWGGWLNIEIKTSHLYYPGIEKAVWDLMQEHRIEKQVFISSFNHETLKRFHELAPEIGTAPLYSEVIYRPWEYAKTFGSDALHPAHRNINAEMVANSHAAGIAVRPWTIDEISDMKRMIDFRVDAVITNRPDRLLEVLGR